jgi:hypothetical protein
MLHQFPSIYSLSHYSCTSFKSQEPYSHLQQHTSDAMLSSLAVSLLATSLLTTAIAGPISARQAVGSITCDFGQANNIATSDITDIINALNSGNPSAIMGLDSDSFPLGDTFQGHNAQTVTQGSFQFMLVNDFVFEATHVSFSTVAGALETYSEQCCGQFAQCIGGSTQVAGDTGIKINLFMQAA